MVAPVEVGEGGIDLLIRNELLKEHETRDRKAVGVACLAALEQWATDRGPWSRDLGQQEALRTYRDIPLFPALGIGIGAIMRDGG